MEQYGADGVRVGMLLCSPAGNDLPFDESLCEQGRNFANKIWNAFRLVKGWETDENKGITEGEAVAIKWFEARMSEVIAELDGQYSSYRLSEALMNIYKLIWDDFCSWFLEMIKPPFGEKISQELLNQVNKFFDEILKLLHPFMPFITETIWQELAPRKEGESIMLAQMPSAKAIDKEVIKGFDLASQLISELRKARARKQMSPKEALEIILAKEEPILKQFYPTIEKLGNVSNISVSSEEPSGSVSFNVGTLAVFVPMGDNVNTEEEKKRLEEELKYITGFLNTVNKKLSNEKFVNGAPEQVVANERKKKEDAEEKIQIIQKQLDAMA